MKTLKTIQTLAKIGRIFSKIIFICCIVGFCVCVAGVASLALGGESFKLGGVTVVSMLGDYSGMDRPALCASLAVGLILFAAEAVPSKFAEIYFGHELVDGTPFTLRGAKELTRLGILTAAIPFGAALICSIGVSVAKNYFPGIETPSIDGYASVALGVMIIVASLFCRYGAELNDKTEDGSLS